MNFLCNMNQSFADKHKFINFNWIVNNLIARNLFVTDLNLKVH